MGSRNPNYSRRPAAPRFTGWPCPVARDARHMRSADRWHALQRAQQIEVLLEGRWLACMYIYICVCIYIYIYACIMKSFEGAHFGIGLKGTHRDT